MAPRMKPSTKIQKPPRRALLGRDLIGDRRRHQRMLAFDHAARDIVGDGIDDRSDIMGFGEHDAAEPGILHKR